MTTSTPWGPPAGQPAQVPDPPPDDEDDDDFAPFGIGDRFRRVVSSGNDSNPLYPRLLRLRHIHPNGWQRAALVEGMALAGAIAALADRATSWAPLILPVAAAAVVKFHDVIAGVLPARARDAEPEE